MNLSSRATIFLGIYLILAGVAGYLSNPEGAKTALLSGGTFGSLCVAWGVLIGRGFGWARLGVLATFAILTAAFIWRSVAGWMAVAGGEQSKWFAAALITSMLIATLAAAFVVLRSRTSCVDSPPQ